MPEAGVSCRLTAGSTGRRVPDLDCLSGFALVRLAGLICPELSGQRICG
jgi:hypothetical protein